MNDWPTIIVGIKGDSTDLACEMETGSGTFVSQQAGCPVELDATRFLCTCPFNTAPRDTSARVTITKPENRTAISETTVPLKEFNYCGRNIAYVEYDPALDSWTSPRYISPCAAP